jgi:hypothetical protein
MERCPESRRSVSNYGLFLSVGAPGSRVLAVEYRGCARGEGSPDPPALAVFGYFLEEAIDDPAVFLRSYPAAVPFPLQFVEPLPESRLLSLVLKQ